MVINTEALLLCGWRHPEPSCLTTFDEVGNIYPSPPLFFPGRQKSNCRIWGLLTTSRAAPAGMFHMQPRGECCEKNPRFLWSRYCPQQVQNLFCLGSEPAHLQGEGHNADSNSTFFLHSFQLQQILLSPLTVPAISPTSHTFYSGFFFFSLKQAKNSKQNRVCKLGEGRSIILAVLPSEQREMLFIHAQHIIQPKWQALLWRNPGLSWLPESITTYSQGGGGLGARQSRGGCQQDMGKFTLCQPAWHSTSFVEKCKSASSFSQALKCTVSPPPSLPLSQNWKRNQDRLRKLPYISINPLS